MFPKVCGIRQLTFIVGFMTVFRTLYFKLGFKKTLSKLFCSEKIFWVNGNSMNISDNDKCMLEFFMCFSEERNMYLQFH